MFCHIVLQSHTHLVSHTANPIVSHPLSHIGLISAAVSYGVIILHSVTILFTQSHLVSHSFTVLLATLLHLVSKASHNG